MATLIEIQKKSKLLGFVELLARSNFSFLKGASHPEEMVEEAIRHDYSGIGICDLHGLYGVVRGYQAATTPSYFTASLHASEKFQYLIGTEFVLMDESSVVLLPMTMTGYQNLCRLITIGKRQAAKGFCRLEEHQIFAHSEDLMAFLIAPLTEERFLRWQEKLGDRLYLPVWRDLTWESREFQSFAFDLEKNHGAQLFATNRPFMHSPERKPIFDVLTCIDHHTTLMDAKTILLQNSERHLKPLDELVRLWEDRIDLVNVTLLIADRLKFRLNEIKYQYPQSNLPTGMKTGMQYLRHLTAEGLKWRFEGQVPESALKMANHELGLIEKLHYEDYFLTLWEICEFAKSRSILYQGRGSAANSVVCFAIGLTNVNPTKVELLFERFISEERNEPPDIDIDFEHARREEVIQHIYEKYDENHAAMICTVIRYRSRMAFRDVAKVLGVPLDTVNRIVKFMGRDGISRLATPGIHQNFQIEEETWALLINLALKMKRFPRHLGIHSGGFLITQHFLSEIVPVEKATMTGRYVIQWNKDDVDFLRLMKIDVLSLGMLTALQKCLRLLKSQKNLSYNLANLPAEDGRTYDMICKAETIGVFQIESRAQMNTLPRLKPKTFYDLVVEVALVRPGPLQGGMVHPYLKRRAGLEKVTYAHPDLEAVLGKTFGVPIFQEQVMQIAIKGAGFTPGEADELRRVMSSAWKKKNTMSGIREKIMTGLQNKGITPEFSEQIYKTIEGFASYGFPESHAASFALLTYASCYLKRHHPDVFTCSLLNSQPMGFYSPRVLIREAQRQGVQILSLDVQKSSYDYTLEGQIDVQHLKNEETPNWPLLPLRVGLKSVSRIPEVFMKRIEDSRNQDGAFQSLQDFIRRTSLPKAALTSLAAAGAFESLEPETRKLLWKIESLSLDRESFTWGLPQENFSKKSEAEETQHLPFESNWDVMQREYAQKGFSIEHHPMSVLRSWINERNEILTADRFIPYSSSQQLPLIKHKSKVRVAGLVSITQRPPTAKGFCFITLEDEFGFINIVVPPDIYQKDRAVIYSKSLFEVHGTIEKVGVLINIRASRLLPLQEEQATGRLENIYQNTRKHTSL